MKTDSRKIRLQWLSCIVAVAVLGLAVGCGGDGAQTQDPSAGMDADQKAVADLVGKISDISGTLPRLRAIFTKDTQPTKATADEFKVNMFNPTDIVVSGDSATLNVEITGIEENAVPSQKSWKAQKVDGEWKLSDTPL